MNAKAPAERKAFKDWFDRKAARALGAQVAGAMPDFDQRAFVRLAARNLGSLAFSGRVQQFADALAATLPQSVPEALAVLTRSLPPLLPDTEAVTDGWLQWPVGQYVADHGLPHFDEAMDAMVALTQRFSSEFAVRPFVEHRPEETFARLLTLTGHDSPHVRRWCSEGTRPRLPWGKRLRALVDDPSPIWPIVEALRDDESLYVRRSVANNLNDIAKDHPAWVVRRCKAWSKKSNPRRDWTIKHALRTLIKEADAGALALVGYGPPDGLTATLAAKPKRIAIGEDVELRATLSNSKGRAQAVMVDYVVDYVRQGGRSGEKVFKWTKSEVAAGSAIDIVKRHRMRPTTIRALYPGKHVVALQVNGERLAQTHFHLR